MTYISSVSASDDATVDFLSSFSATYDDYIVRFNNLVPASNSQFLRTDIAIGGTALSGSTDYDWAVKGGDDQGVLKSNNSAGGSHHIRTAGRGIGNATNESASGEVQFLGVNNTSLYKMTISFVSYFDDVFEFGVGGGQYNGSTTAWSGCRFWFGTGNVASGDFHLYGIKKA